MNEDIKKSNDEFVEAIKNADPKVIESAGKALASIVRAKIAVAEANEALRAAVLAELEDKLGILKESRNEQQDNKDSTI